MVEVKPEAVRRDKAAGLEGGGADELVERGVQKVGRRVVAGGEEPLTTIDLGDHAAGKRLGAERAVVDLGDVGEAGGGLLRVDNAEDELAVGALDEARVARLTAGFGVEGGLGEEDVEPVGAGVGAEAEHLCGRLEAVVTDELVGGSFSDDDPLAGHFVAGVGGAAPVALALHGYLVAGAVDAEAALTGHDLGEVGREAEGVVELEDVVSRDRLAALCGGGLRDFVEEGDAPLQRAEEALLFGLDDGLRLALLAAELGVDMAEVFDDRGGHFEEEGLGEAQVAPVSDRATEDAAEDVAAALVGEGGAVTDAEHDCPHMVGDDAVLGEVGAVEELRRLDALARQQEVGALEDACEEAGVEDVVDARHDGRRPVEAHARVDRLHRQRGERAGVVTVELHEDMVPDFEEALAIEARGPGGEAILGVVVVVDFGAGAAGAGGTHRPEVLFVAGLHVAEADDVVGREAELLLPDVPRLVVVLVDRDIEAGGVELHHLGDELPAPLERLALVVLAEGPVPEHLKEGEVAAILADLVEVVVLASGADALLSARGPHVVALLESKEHILELVHACVGEEQRRVALGDDGARGDHGVELLGEVVEKGAAKLVGSHGRSVLA